MKKRPMSPEEFCDRMKKILDDHDLESAHSDADELMCEVLRQLGYGDGVKVFELADKWYA